MLPKEILSKSEQIKQHLTALRIASGGETNKQVLDIQTNIESLIDMLAELSYNEGKISGVSDCVETMEKKMGEDEENEFDEEEDLEDELDNGQ